jgi:hypothetical protein
VEDVGPDVRKGSPSIIKKTDMFQWNPKNYHTNTCKYVVLLGIKIAGNPYLVTTLRSSKLPCLVFRVGGFKMV